MQIVDANVLLYAVNADAAHHRPSVEWLDGALESNETVGFAWTVLLAFLRVGTRADVFARPLLVEEAVDQVHDWLAHRSALLVEPTTRHATILRSFLAATGAAGNLVNDAHLAALAVEHDAVIVSFDRDFERFEGVRRRAP